MELVEEIYRISRKFPEDERFGLSAQVRRAAVSIPSNIAEGYGRAHRPDYVRFLSISRGSLAEVQTQMIIAGRLGFVTMSEMRSAWRKSEAVGKMLTAMIVKLSESPRASKIPSL